MICLIHILTDTHNLCSAVMHFFGDFFFFFFVDSRFARCIFTWRCQRIPIRPGPLPAKKLCQASSWLEVWLSKACTFYTEFWSAQTWHQQWVSLQSRVNKLSFWQPQGHKKLVTQCPVSLLKPDPEGISAKRVHLWIQGIHMCVNIYYSCFFSCANVPWNDSLFCTPQVISEQSCPLLTLACL